MISFAAVCLIVIFTIFLSLLVGWHARNWLGKPSPLEQGLRLELSDLKKEMHDYQQDVNTHFKKTADLFNNLIKQSKILYEHLLSSSKTLCRSESESESVMNFLAESRDNENNWQEIVMQSPSHNNATYQSREQELGVSGHNWHPTYAEASQIKNTDTDSETTTIIEKK